MIANVFAAIFTLIFSTQYGLTGFQFNQQPIVQMLAGYLHPGKPLANMYFTVFAFNGVQQGQLLARDLKLAQFAHLSFKATFTFQILGCVLGSIFNYIMMQTIVSAQVLFSSLPKAPISGQVKQSSNTTRSPSPGRSPAICSPSAHAINGSRSHTLLASSYHYPSTLPTDTPRSSSSAT